MYFSRLYLREPAKRLLLNLYCLKAKKSDQKLIMKVHNAIVWLWIYAIKTKTINYC